MLTALNLLSWLRGFSYLRLFQKTRVLIRLVIEVIIDMIPFTIILIFSMLAFATTFAVLIHPTRQGYEDSRNF